MANGEPGRPTDYKPEYDEQARKLCLLGFTDKQLADFFNVCEATINNWKTDHPSFLESLTRGKDIANADVADSLYQRAMGYEHPEDKIFQYEGVPIIVPTVKRYPPDTGAALSFLKNRAPDLWRDKHELELSGKLETLNQNINYDEISPEDAKELFFSTINQQED